jgi:diaminopimelate decarboxylase
MYDSHHDIELLRNGNVVPRESDKLIEQTVTGNICESGDILAKNRPLPKINEGDLICVLDTGAYGWSMCSTYNSRPRPAEVLICADGSVKQIRRKETIEDLLNLFD